MRTLFILLCLAIPGALFAQASTSVNATINTGIYQTDQNTIQMSPGQRMSAPAEYKYVDQMPSFPGDLREFISKNLVYPDSALKAGIKGDLMVQFIVKKDGSLSGITLVKRANPILEKEALRLMSVMPKWIPGKDKGQTIDAMYLLPLSFNP